MHGLKKQSVTTIPATRSSFGGLWLYCDQLEPHLTTNSYNVKDREETTKFTHRKYVIFYPKFKPYKKARRKKNLIRHWASKGIIDRHMSESLEKIHEVFIHSIRKPCVYIMQPQLSTIIHFALSRRTEHTTLHYTLQQQLHKKPNRRNKTHYGSPNTALSNKFLNGTTSRIAATTFESDRKQVCLAWIFLRKNNLKNKCLQF